MMKLTITGNTDAFKYLWLRYVTGFDPNQHCARCLLAKRDPRVTVGMVTPQTLNLLEISKSYAYLCGGTPEWATNVHMVLVPQRGSIVERVVHGGVRIRVGGAKELPIPDLPKGFHNMPDEFTTCRNWRAGVAFYPRALNGLDRNLPKTPNFPGLGVGDTPVI